MTDDGHVPGTSTPAHLRERYAERRDRIRTEMGGERNLARIRSRGRSTARERLDALLDKGSFLEVGTFAASAHRDLREETPGDGLIGGFGEIDGRGVAVAADDVSVRQATSADTNQKKFHRVLSAAIRQRTPMVFLAERGGGRIPDIVEAEGFMRQALPDTVSPQLLRHREIPLVTVVLGDSYGQAAMIATMSDFVVQVRGTTFALTSERLAGAPAVGGGAVADFGSAEWNLHTTGRIDAIAEDEEEALALVRTFLSFLPQSAHDRAEELAGPRRGADEAFSRVLPDRSRRAYDGHDLLRALFDEGEYLELRQGLGRSAITAVGRIGGVSVGVVGSQPMAQAGALTPEAVEKIVRLLVLCEAYNLPVVFAVDTPGFAVGMQAEEDRLIQRAVLLMQAVAMLTTPVFCVVTRKAYGLAFALLGGSARTSRAVLSWPTAEIGFMDPTAAAGILFAQELRDLHGEDRLAALRTRAAEVGRDFTPDGPAAVMLVDEIIDPADTARWLDLLIRRERSGPVLPVADRPLLTWPGAW